ncbi:MAG: thioesterase [Methylococcales bacterium]|jgi:acyl-CoA thioester hydrolase|nr:thioesterase [Methylococcales bacterium]MBT7410679.1 thioesterase [Methylococcales bacterium]
MNSKVYHFSVQIYYEDTDHSGVVYHPNFLKYFERAREHVIGSHTLSTLWDEHGLGFAVYKAEMGFFDGVVFADIVDIKTHYKIDGKFMTHWRQEVWRENAVKPAVTGDIQMVCMDKDKQLRPIPELIYDLLK